MSPPISILSIVGRRKTSRGWPRPYRRCSRTSGARRPAMDSRLERWATFAAAVGLLLSSCRRAPAPTAVRRPSGRSVRITMDALHRAGGVPPGWRLTPPAGDIVTGRRLFVDFGCASCHTINGEAFAATAAEQGVGPDLTGTGSHHPP